MATRSNAPSLASIYQSTGERLAALRKEQGHTQGDLAELLGTTKATISRYESNLIDIPISKLQKLASYFGVTPAFLMCWTDDTKGGREVFAGTSVLPKVEVPDPLEDLLLSAKAQEKADRQEKELLEIFRSLSVRGQTKLLSVAFELQDKEQASI